MIDHLYLGNDCCQDKASARRGGMFEGPVGDDWYICECQRKTYQAEQEVGPFKRLLGIFRKP